MHFAPLALKFIPYILGTGCTCNPPPPPERDSSIPARDVGTHEMDSGSQEEDSNITERTPNACGDFGPLPREICDGIDNNCDGQTDEGAKNPCGYCGPVPRDIACDWKLLGDSPPIGFRKPWEPKIVWNASNQTFAVAWLERNPDQIQLIHVDANGNTIGKERTLTQQATDPLSLSYGDRTYALAWHHLGPDSGPTLQTFDATTFQAGTRTFLGSLPQTSIPKIIWDGAHFATLYRASKDPSRPQNEEEHEYFQKFDRLGNAVSNAKKIGENFLSEFRASGCYWNGVCPDLPYATSFVWVESLRVYGILWNHVNSHGDNPTTALYLSLLDEEGNERDTSKKVYEKPFMTNYRWIESPQLLWDGSQLGILWNNGPNIYFSGLDEDLNIAGEVRNFLADPGVVEESINPTVIWTGENFQIAWQSFHSVGDNLGYSRVNLTSFLLEDFSPQQPFRVISNANARPWGHRTQMAWSGSNLGVLWLDEREEGHRVYPLIHFTLVSP